MPYISDDVFKRLVFGLLGKLLIADAGKLAYLVQQIMLQYWQEKPSFSRWAEMRGAIEDQVDEFRRRVVVPYEEQKRKENGDVFKA